MWDVMAINPPYYDWQIIASCENELRAQEIADAYFRAYKATTKIMESEPIYRPPEKLAEIFRYGQMSSLKKRKL